MAKILKQRARKPVVETAGVVGSRGTDGYCLQLYPADRSANYDVFLTREEMLRVVASWMASESRDATDAAKAAAKQ